MNNRSQPGPTPARPGAVLKRWRALHGLTLTDVSQRTGLPVSTLSKVENDKMSLTYDKLARLSEGLGLDIARFFGGANESDEAPVNITGRRSITRTGEGIAIETGAYGHLYPAADLLKKKFVPIVADVRARTLEEFGDLIRHAGEEYAWVIEGEVELHTDLYAPVRLKAGDSIYFDSGMGHAYLNVGEGVCRVLSICSAGESQLMAVSRGQAAQVAERSLAPKVRARG